MKKLIVCFGLLIIMLTACTQQTKPANAEVSANTASNFTDEMKIAYQNDLDTEDGADNTEREGDHQNSPYFTSLDYYNMESTDTLTIIPHFKTQQQTSEWSCGLSAMVMVLEHYGLLGDYTEESLAQMRSNGLEPEGTTLKDVVNILETVTGRETESTYDYPGDQIYEFMTLEPVSYTHL